MNIKIESRMHEHPFPGNVLMHVEHMNEYEDETRTPVSNPDDANVVSSIYPVKGADLHRPVLDIDLPAALIPSTTPGHFHLYLDAPMSWANYARLLRVLAEVGIIEEGYASVSIERQHTAVRVPWIRKGEDTLRGYSAQFRQFIVDLGLKAIRRG